MVESVFGKAAKMTKCLFDPVTYTGPAQGMFHCPECDEMVVAGVPHPDYDDMDHMIVESSGSKVVKSPWTNDQVRNLAEWQKGIYFHPYTCPNDGEVLVPTKHHFFCPSCSYIQDWCHDFSCR